MANSFEKRTALISAPNKFDLIVNLNAALLFHCFAAEPIVREAALNMFQSIYVMT